MRFVSGGIYHRGMKPASGLMENSEGKGIWYGLENNDDRQ
jgi:hypothetical protein